MRHANAIISGAECIPVCLPPAVARLFSRASRRSEVRKSLVGVEWHECALFIYSQQKSLRCSYNGTPPLASPPSHIDRTAAFVVLAPTTAASPEQLTVVVVAQNSVPRDLRGHQAHIETAAQQDHRISQLHKENSRCQDAVRLPHRTCTHAIAFGFTCWWQW